jgi:hypothetical protein
MQRRNKSSPPPDTAGHGSWLMEALSCTADLADQHTMSRSTPVNRYRSIVDDSPVDWSPDASVSTFTTCGEPRLGRDLESPKSATLMVPTECSRVAVSASMNDDPPTMMLAGFRSRWMMTGCRLCMYAIARANSSVISTCRGSAGVTARDVALKVGRQKRGQRRTGKTAREQAAVNTEGGDDRRRRERGWEQTRWKQTIGQMTRQGCGTLHLPAQRRREYKREDSREGAAHELRDDQVWPLPRARAEKLHGVGVVDLAERRHLCAEVTECDPIRRLQLFHCDIRAIVLGLHCTSDVVSPPDVAVGEGHLVESGHVA